MQSFRLHILFLTKPNRFMKKILLVILLMPILSFSQEKEVLKYFKSKDSLVGVKDQNGKIIVPAQFKVFSYLKDGELIKGETIYFDGFKNDEKPRKMNGVTSTIEKEISCTNLSFMTTEQIISLKV